MWHEWDEDSRFSFDIDWPVVEDRLHLLKHWAGQGKMTPDQSHRYEQLLRLVDEQRPTLERLLAE